jgi:competence protein ComEA
MSPTRDKVAKVRWLALGAGVLTILMVLFTQGTAMAGAGTLVAQPASAPPAETVSPQVEKATPEPEPDAKPKAAKPAKEKKEAPKLAPGQRVNINKASQEELEKIPGIGPAKAKAIIKGRPYKNPQDIMKVKGIKKGIYNKIKDFISVQ